MKCYALVFLFLVACGNLVAEPDSSEPTEPQVILIDPHQQYLTIGPPIAAAPEAVALIEELVGCDILTWCEINPDIRVEFDNRNCGQAGYSSGTIFINDPERCPWVEDIWGVGLAVHEIFHALGHGGHDENRFSVMHPTIEINWYVEEEDIEWLREKYCKAPLL